MSWNYINKEGNPVKEGAYWVTLIYPERKGDSTTGRTLASVARRFFKDASKTMGWIMDGEEGKDKAWATEFESVPGERVIAWKPIDSIDIAELPEGVILDTCEA